MRFFRHMYCCIVAFVFLFAVASPGANAASPEVTEITPPKNVLLIGNSFTFYNNGLHTHLRALAREADKDSKYLFRIVTISGGLLADHRFGYEGTLASKPWDAVILQGNSNEPIREDRKEGFVKYATVFAEQARAANIQPVFFMTWAYADKPEMTGPLCEAYTDIANKTKAMVSPVGLAFARATKERPDIRLIIADKLHPTMAGSYLAACTLYASLMGKSPEGLAYAAGLDQEWAAFLQKTAWATVTEFYAR